jgi:hypothetical protein
LTSGRSFAQEHLEIAEEVMGRAAVVRQFLEQARNPHHW